MNDLRVRLLISAENTSGPQLNQARNDVRGIDDQMALLNTRFNQFLALKAAEVISGWGAALVRTADNYQTLSSKLDLATDSHKELIAVQKALFDIAQDSRAQINLTENAYIKNADAIKRMGGTTEQALTVTEILNKAIASTSQGLQQDEAALNQWSQALGKGVLNGDELNSIMENSYGLTQALADGMGVPIGKLKELGEQGKLTGTDLINALLSQQAHIDEVFNSMPMTVQQSLTLIDNAWTQFIGKANEAYGVTQTLADGFAEISRHIPALVEGSLQLAAIYGVKLAASLALYVDGSLSATAASRAAVAAAEHEVIVNLELLRVQTEVTVMRVNAMRAMLEEARLERALAVTAQDAAVAQERLALAARNVAVAEEAAAGASLAYRNALSPIVAESTLAAGAAGLLSKAFNGLFLAWIAYEGLQFASDHFESVRLQFVDLAKDFAEIEAVVLHFTSGDFLDSTSATLDQKLTAINESFDQIRRDNTDAGREALEQSKRQHEQETKLLEAQKIARETAFKELQTQLKETSTQIEAEYARQNTSIKQALEARKTEVMASALPELQKEAAISKAIEESNAARLLTIQQAADKKLLLLDQVYGAELAKLKAGTIEQKTVEKLSIEERIAVYSQLEKNYSGIIDGLIADEQRHAQASANLLEQRAQLEQDTESAIRSIRQAGMSDEELLTDQKRQLDENLAAQRQALAEGDVENAKKYGEEAAKLAQELATQSEAAYKAGQGYSSDADGFIRKFEQARAGIGEALDKEREAHQTQQQHLADSIADTQSKLTATQNTIAELGEQLREKFLLKIDADSSAVDAAIERIKQPTESTHTIHVIEESGGRAVIRNGDTFTDAPDAGAPEGLQKGGPIQAFADGGFPRVQGQLPGYGGGDRVKALLEDGEFVLRKEAVAANGPATIQALNDGKVKIDAVRRLRWGGPVMGPFADEMAALDDERDKKVIERMISNTGAFSVNRIGMSSRTEAIQNASQVLQKIGRPDLMPKVAEIMSLKLQAGKIGGSMMKEAGDRAKVLQNHLFDEVGTHPALDAIRAQPARQALTPNIPVISQPASQLIHGARGGGSKDKVVTVKFQSPNGGPSVTGQFAEADVDTLLRTLQDAAAAGAQPGRNY